MAAMPSLPSREDLRDLESAMRLLRDVFGRHTLRPADLESRLGWPQGELEEWLEKPLEARLVDYLRLLRLAAESMTGEASDLDVEEPPSEPDILDSIVHGGDDRDSLGSGTATFAPGDDSDRTLTPRGEPLRTVDLVFRVVIVLVMTGHLTAGEVRKSVEFFEQQLLEAQKRC